MLARYGAAALLFSAAMCAASLPAAAQQNSTAPRNAEEADQAYPKAYVCKNIQYNQVDDKPGTCTADKTPLVAIRLGIVYKCLRGPAEYQADPGPCRVTGPNQPKVPVTASVFWTCPGSDAPILDPGRCSDGTPRKIGFEERPHGDHNPRHGGATINMSKDLFHHMEATLTAPNLLRVYFYNEFTKPAKIDGMTGTVALENSNFQATGTPIPLKVVNIADGNALEANIPNVPVPSKNAPVYVKVMVKLPGENWLTDQTFVGYSIDPAPPAPAKPPTTTGAARSSQPGAAPKAPIANAGRSTQPNATPTNSARAATPKPAPAKPATPAPKPATPPPSAPTSSGPAQEPAAPSSGIMAGSAEVSGGPTGVQVVLPEGRPNVLAFLKENAANVSQLLEEGQLGGMWYPALNAKDAGLALEQLYEDGLSEEQKGQLSSAVKQLTVVAWQIDAAGDLGNGEQLHLLRNQFDAAVKDILAVYGQ